MQNVAADAERFEAVFEHGGRVESMSVRGRALVRLYAAAYEFVAADVARLRSPTEATVQRGVAASVELAEAGAELTIACERTEDRS